MNPGTLLPSTRKALALLDSMPWANCTNAGIVRLLMKKARIGRSSAYRLIAAYKEKQR